MGTELQIMQNEILNVMLNSEIGGGGGGVGVVSGME